MPNDETPVGVPPPVKFLETDSRREQCARLTEGLGTRAPFLLVTGAAGTGKTSVVREAVARWGSRAVAAFVAGAATRTELLESIARRFGVELPPNATRAQLVDRLERRFAEAEGDAQIPVIVADDAHELSDELLGELWSLVNAALLTQRPLEIVLVGLPSLEDRLDVPALRAMRERISVRCRVTPFSQHETRRYLQEVVSATAPEGTGFLPRKACREIFERTGGAPGPIDRLATAAMNGARAAGARVVTPGLVAFAAGALGMATAGTPRAYLRIDTASLDEHEDRDEPRPIAARPERAEKSRRVAAEPARAEKPPTTTAEPAQAEKPPTTAGEPQAENPPTTTLEPVKAEEPRTTAAEPHPAEKPPAIPAEPAKAERPRTTAAEPRQAEKPPTTTAETAKTEQPRTTAPAPTQVEKPSTTTAEPAKAEKPRRVAAEPPVEEAAIVAANPTPVEEVATVARAAEPVAHSSASAPVPEAAAKRSAPVHADRRVGDWVGRFIKPDEPRFGAWMLESGPTKRGASAGPETIEADSEEPVAAESTTVDDVVPRRPARARRRGDRRAGERRRRAPWRRGRTVPLVPVGAAVLIVITAVVLIVLPRGRAPAARPHARPVEASREARPAGKARSKATVRESAPRTAKAQAKPNARPSRELAHGATPPPAETPRASAQRFALGVGTYLYRDQAEAERDRIVAATNLEGWLIDESRDGDESYRVVVGIYKTRDRAESSAQLLLDQDLVSEAVVIPLPPRSRRR